MKNAAREQNCKQTEGKEVPDVYQLIALILAMISIYMQSEEAAWVALWFVFSSYMTLRKSSADYRQLLSSMLFSLFAIFQARKFS